MLRYSLKSTSHDFLLTNQEEKLHVEVTTLIADVLGTPLHFLTRVRIKSSTVEAAVITGNQHGGISFSLSHARLQAAKIAPCYDISI